MVDDKGYEWIRTRAKNNDNDEDDAEKFAEETMNANVNMN